MIQIRTAQPADAEGAAMLLASAYMHAQISYPPSEGQESGFSERLQGYFRQEGNRFSYQNIQVAELDSSVVGLVLSFGGRDELRLNTAIGSWLEREAQDDEWYIDGLAVFSNWGNRGIGTKLLLNAEQQAHQHSYPKVALHVAVENKRALNLYTRQHYVVTGKATLYQRAYVRMVKVLKSEAQP